jgi:hypothetical protein
MASRTIIVKSSLIEAERNGEPVQDIEGRHLVSSSTIYNGIRLFPQLPSSLVFPIPKNHDIARQTAID